MPNCFIGHHLRARAAKDRSPIASRPCLSAAGRYTSSPSFPRTKTVRSWLHRGRACFETRLLGAPQHEVSLCHQMKILILRRPRTGHLEGPTKVTQLDVQFRYSLETQNAYPSEGYGFRLFASLRSGCRISRVVGRFSAS